MGRAINTENKIDALDHRLKLVEDALEELVQNNSRVHHIDLTDERNIRAEGVEVKPDKKVTRKNTKHKEPKEKALTL